MTSIRASSQSDLALPLAPDESTMAEIELAARELREERRLPARLSAQAVHTLLPRMATGALSGCLATGVMTAVMLALQQALPWRERYPLPPRRIIDILARRLGLRRKLERTDLNVITAIGHFGYGASAGALYAPLGLALRLPGLASGIVYGLLVWAGSYLGLLPVLGILPPATRHPAGRNALMIAAHVVWGASLGWLTERIARRGDRRYPGPR